MIKPGTQVATLRAIRGTNSRGALDLRIFRLGQDVTHLALLQLRSESPRSVDDYAHDLQRLSRQLYACATRTLELAKKGGRRA